MMYALRRGLTVAVVVLLFYLDVVSRTRCLRPSRLALGAGHFDESQCVPVSSHCDELPLMSRLLVA
jgi:hypothetical protein